MRGNPYCNPWSRKSLSSSLASSCVHVGKYLLIVGWAVSGWGLVSFFLLRSP